MRTKMQTINCFTSFVNLFQKLYKYKGNVFSSITIERVNLNGVQFSSLLVVLQQHIYIC